MKDATFEQKKVIHVDGRQRQLPNIVKIRLMSSKCKISWLLSIICFCFFKFSCFGVILLFQQFCLEKRQNNLVEIVELANYCGKYLVILCKVSANIDPARLGALHSPKKILSKNKFAKQKHRFHFQFLRFTTLKLWSFQAFFKNESKIVSHFKQ